MHRRRRNTEITRTCRTAGALGAALVALGASATPARAGDDGASACARFGDKPAYELRHEPARNAMVCLINRERHERGLPGLDQNHKLQRAAQRHNERMLSKQCFAHQCPGEGTLEARLYSVEYLGGLSAWAYSENLVWAERWLSTPRAMVKAWMNSPGHRANLLSPDYKEIGIGSGDGSPRNRKARAATFTADFGMRRQ